ncbi:plasmid mobilization relaxosome protein MobC [Candidatus Bathyarchaeota archaeon]|nr:plasmid mobilization relaxosome protein MobC [Candidatus Bathyarchaeota archaeon]
MKKQKDKTYAFRVSSADLSKIKARAKKAKLTVTDYLVTSALDKEIVVIDGVEPLIGQMKAVGRNLNQLTTLAHMGRIEAVRLDEVSEAFGDIASALNRLTREVK